MVVGLIAFAIAIAVSHQNLAAAYPGDTLAGMSVVFYVALAIAFLIVFGGLGGVRKRLGFRYTNTRDIGFTLAVWVASVLAGGLAEAAFTPLLGKPPATSRPSYSLGLVHDPVFLTLMVFSLVLLGPVCEELLFRGALFGWVNRYTAPVLGIFVTAVIFALAHAILALFPFLFVMGLSLGLVYWRTGSTFNSSILHMAQNAFAAVAAFAYLSGR